MIFSLALLNLTQKVLIFKGFCGMNKLFKKYKYAKGFRRKTRLNSIKEVEIEKAKERRMCKITVI